MVHLLERAPAEVLEGPLTAEDQDRGVGAPGVRDSRHAVGHAGAGRDGRDADRPGVAARPGVGGVDRRLLVPHVDDLDPLVDAAVVEGHDVSPGESEDDLDAGLLESLGRELSAVKGHVGTPTRRGFVHGSMGRTSAEQLGTGWGANGPLHPRRRPDPHDITGPEAGPSERRRPPTVKRRTPGFAIGRRNRDPRACHAIRTPNEKGRWMHPHPPALRFAGGDRRRAGVP